MRLIPETVGGKIAAAGCAVMLAGGLFWFLAPYNIAASKAHMPGVSTVLHGYLKNAVRTWAWGIEPPDHIDLADPALVRLGAGHFETGCATCHGAPGRARNPIVLGMLPTPPTLDEVDEYGSNELYWIGLNGFKYSGMPAWPGKDRPDEPWAVAAFLRTYPSLDEDTYLDLAFGEAKTEGIAAGMDFGGYDGDIDTLADCSRCHGEDGLGRDGTAPKLAGQSETYLHATLDAYAEGRRESGFMEPVAASLDAEERASLARHYAKMPRFAPSEGEADAALVVEDAALVAEDAALVAEGAALAARGDERREIPSCLSCHAVDRDGPPPRPEYPHIAGQTERWLQTWLHRWRERPLGGTRYAEIMHRSAATLTDAQIDALAAFFAAGAER